MKGTCLKTLLVGLCVYFVLGENSATSAKTKNAPLVQGDNEFQKGKENTPVSNRKENIPVQMCPTVTCSSNVFGSLFSGVNNCNITISPQNFQ